MDIYILGAIICIGLIIRTIYFQVGEIYSREDKKKIKRMQYQIDELCRFVGYDELMSTYISDEDQKFIKHLKNTGKEVGAIKKIRDITGLDLKEAKKYFDSI